MDDREECERLEREGVFIQTGDLVFITGFINAGAGQEWVEYGFEDLDPRFVDIILEEDIEMKNECDEPTGEVQTLEILKGKNTGRTIYSIALTWNGVLLRRVRFEIFVNMAYQLTVMEPQRRCLCGPDPQCCGGCCR